MKDDTKDPAAVGPPAKTDPTEDPIFAWQPTFGWPQPDAVAILPNGEVRMVDFKTTELPLGQHERPEPSEECEHGIVGRCPYCLRDEF